MEEVTYISDLTVTRKIYMEAMRAVFSKTYRIVMLCIGIFCAGYLCIVILPHLAEMEETGVIATVIFAALAIIAIYLGFNGYLIQANRGYKAQLVLNHDVPHVKVEFYEDRIHLESANGRRADFDYQMVVSFRTTPNLYLLVLKEKVTILVSKDLKGKNGKTGFAEYIREKCPHLLTTGAA